LKSKLDYINSNATTSEDSIIQLVQKDLAIVKKEIGREAFKKGIEDINLNKALSFEGFNPQVHQILVSYLDNLKDHYLDTYNLSVLKKEKLMSYYEKSEDYDYDFNEYKNKYFNESLSDLVRNIAVKERMIEYQGNLIQQIDPVFNSPDNPAHVLDYRTHFFAPRKHFFGTYFNTFYFNILVIWFMTLLLYITLYYELLGKIIESFSKVKIPKAKG